MTSDSINYQRALPRMMLNIFDRNAKMLGSLMRQRTSQRTGSTHVRSGLTHRRRRISAATRDTIEFLLFCSVPGWD